MVEKRWLLLPDFWILFKIVELYRPGLKARNTQFCNVCLVKKNPYKYLGHFFFNIFLAQFRENTSEVRTLLWGLSFFWENLFSSFIYILTMFFFNYTHMKMTHWSQPQPNMSSIREGCNSLGKTFLTSLVGKHWATGALWVNLYSVNKRLIRIEGNVILPTTTMAGCDIDSHSDLDQFDVGCHLMKIPTAGLK